MVCVGPNAKEAEPTESTNSLKYENSSFNFLPDTERPGRDGGGTKEPQDADTGPTPRDHTSRDRALSTLSLTTDVVVGRRKAPTHPRTRLRRGEGPVRCDSALTQEGEDSVQDEVWTKKGRAVHRTLGSHLRRREEGAGVCEGTGNPTRLTTYTPEAG